MELLPLPPVFMIVSTSRAGAKEEEETASKTDSDDGWLGSFKSRTMIEPKADAI